MVLYALEELARLVGGKVIGDRDVKIGGVAGIKEAHEGEITFLANPKYESYLATTQASAVIADHADNSPKPVIKQRLPVCFRSANSMHFFTWPGNILRARNWYPISRRSSSPPLRMLL